VKPHVQDQSPVQSLVFTPDRARLQLGGAHVSVQVEAVDVHGNANRCRFQATIFNAKRRVILLFIPTKI
jgi:hypothetical protein